MFTELRLTGEDYSLNLAVGPSHGPPLILLHGVTQRWQTFVPVAADLSTRWKLHALDFAGHGQSANSSGDYRVKDYLNDVAPLFETLDQPAVVFGHSLGSMVAAAVAAEFPDQVRAVILEDPPLTTMGERIKESVLLSHFRNMQKFVGDNRNPGEIAESLAEARLVDPQTGIETRLGDTRDGTSLRFAASCLKKVDPRVFLPIVEGRWMEGYETEAIFRGIRCPTLLLQGDVAAGGMLTDEDAEMVESLVEDITRIKLPGVGHSIHWTETQRFMNLAHGFLESV